VAKANAPQHYVPRSYLAAWCDPGSAAGQEPYVWVFDRNSRDGRRKSPKKLFAEIDFYTILREDGSRDLVLEKGLADLESKFASARRKIARHEQLTEPEYLQLLTFVASMLARTKRRRDHYRARFSEMKDLMDRVDDAYRSAGPEQRKSLDGMFSGFAPPEWSRLSYDDVAAVVRNPMRHTFAAKMNETLPILRRMRAVVFETSDEVGFITSDQPCIVFDPDAWQIPPTFRNHDIEASGAEVTLPLSPQQMLVLTWRNVIPRAYPIPTQFVDDFNRRIRRFAHERFVACRNVTKDIWFAADPELNHDPDQNEQSSGP
jgi:hypothetical protein